MDIQFSKPTSKILSSAQGQRKDYSLFEVGLIIIMIVLFYFFLIKPKQAELGGFKTTESQLAEEQTKVQYNVETLQKLIGDLDTYKQDIANLDEMLPLRGSSIRLNMLLSDTADDAGLTVASLSVTPPANPVVAGDKELVKDPFKPQRSLKKMDINMSVTGNIDQLTNFIRKIETSGRLIDISAMQIQSSKGSQLQANLTMSSYYFAN